MNNKFIVLEGIDGSGKSTLAKNLAKKIVDNVEFEKVECLILEEPTKIGKYGIQIRNILKSNTQDNEETGQILLDLFLKDRYWDIETRIKPALEKNKIVILDRYYFSTAAYQAHSFVQTKKIINEYLQNQRILDPDILFYIDLKPQQALERMSARSKQTEIFEKEISLERIYNQYNYIWEMFDFRFPMQKINGNQSEEKLCDEIFTKLK